MASLKRVERALSQMTATNIRANQQAIGDFNELLSEGSNKLQDLFRTALLEDVQKIEPLHYITKRRLHCPSGSYTMLTCNRIAVSGHIKGKNHTPECDG